MTLLCERYCVILSQLRVHHRVLQNISVPNRKAAFSVKADIRSWRVQVVRFTWTARHGVDALYLVHSVGIFCVIDDAVTRELNVQKSVLVEIWERFARDENTLLHSTEVFECASQAYRARRIPRYWRRTEEVAAGRHTGHPQNFGLLIANKESPRIDDVVIRVCRRVKHLYPFQQFMCRQLNHKVPRIAAPTRCGVPHFSRNRVQVSRMCNWNWNVRVESISDKRGLTGFLCAIVRVVEARPRLT